MSLTTNPFEPQPENQPLLAKYLQLKSCEEKTCGTASPVEDLRGLDINTILNSAAESCRKITTQPLVQDSAKSEALQLFRDILLTAPPELQAQAAMAFFNAQKTISLGYSDLRFDFIKSLIENKTIPILFVLCKIYRNNKLDDYLKEKYLSPEKLEHLHKIAENLRSYIEPGWIPIYKRAEILNQILANLRAFGDTLPVFIHETLDKSITPYEKELDEVNNTIKEAEIWLKSLPQSKGKSENIPLEVQMAALDLAMVQQRYDLIPDIISCMAPTFSEDYGDEYVYSKPVFAFLLDKMIITPDTPGGNWIWFNAIHLANSLMQVKGEEEALCHQLADIMYRCASLGREVVGPNKDGSSGSNSYQAASEALAMIKEAEIGRPVLIPFSTHRHAVCICIKKQNDKTATLTIYNTGQGSENHYYDSQSHKTQTFLTYDKFPLEALYESWFWLNIGSKFGSGTPMEFYRAIDAYRQRGAYKVEPSTNPLDYEQPQMQVTCAAQCLMAFLRHEIRQMVPESGSDFHKMGVYRMLKARTMIHLGGSRVPHLPESITALAQAKLEQLQSEVSLYETAADLENFQRAKARYDAIFKDLDIIVPEMTTLTSYERFMILRTYQKILVNACIQKPERMQQLKLSPSEDGFYIYRKKQIEQHIAKLQILNDNKDWNELAGTLLRSQQFSSVSQPVIEWFSRLSDIPDALLSPLAAFSKRDDSTTNTYNVLISHLKIFNRNDIIDRLQKLSKTVTASSKGIFL